MNSRLILKKQFIIDASNIVEKPVLSIDRHSNTNIKYPYPYLSCWEFPLENGKMELSDSSYNVKEFSLCKCEDGYALDPFTSYLRRSRNKFDQPYITLKELGEIGWRLPMIEEFEWLMNCEDMDITFNTVKKYGLYPEPHTYIEHYYKIGYNIFIYPGKNYFVTDSERVDLESFETIIKKVTIEKEASSHSTTIPYKINEAKSGDLGYVILMEE